MSMFCFQCEQTAKGSGCTVSGVCGKKPDTANLQDVLTGELIGLARATSGNTPFQSTFDVIINGLFTTITNVNFDNNSIQNQIDAVKREKEKLVPRCNNCESPCTRNDSYDMEMLWNENEDIRSLKSLILFGLRGMAAYAHHARILGKSDDSVNNFFCKGLFAIGEDTSTDDLMTLVMELGTVNLKCMELLDAANTQAYGNPVPVKVSCNVESGPFIVISGHDLRDLKLLLEQTEGKGINIYTHSEMLPAHGYPELKKYPHLKGNYGTAWQNQQSEFDNLPAPILFTTNCLMPVQKSYADRVYTTSVVAYPELKHIGEEKDFSPVIEKALSLGGYKNRTPLATAEQTLKQDEGYSAASCRNERSNSPLKEASDILPCYKEKVNMTGINGGEILTTGFAHGTVLSVSDKIVEAVKGGAIKHFFLVGGCDGAKTGRNYYTEFVKKTPQDSIVLTIACGKYRFNDLDLGEIDGLPRIMDMGQCNDAYSAIKVAVALAEAFNCTVNELPLTLVLSWYEQKAICILLTLFSLGIKNIYIGPSLPAFISPNILNVLVEKFNIIPISSPENDLKKILG